MSDSIIGQLITSLLTGWYDMKMLIEQVDQVSNDAMHIIAGGLLQLLFAIILRRSLASWVPWLAVVAVLLFNEAVDLWVERWPSLAVQLGEGLKDVVLTMLLPTALLFALRWFPALRQNRRR